MNGKRILVVDDGITMRLFYRDTLERAGFEVEEAVNGLEGLERAMRSRFDCIVVDVNMPKMDGHTMIDRMRQDSSMDCMPVLTISTESEESDIDRALQAGANFYIVKPADPNDLAATVALMSGAPR